jgi:DNA-binding NtrC family response regulator
MDRGLALVRLNRLVEARQELTKALRLCRRQASPRRVAIALEYTGEYHLANGDSARAATALRRALAIANRIAPEGDIVPEVRRRQAEVALARANAEEALEIARDADQRAAKLGDRYERATALRVEGQALRELNQDAEAIRILREALAILEDLGETFERDRILRMLGDSVDDDETDRPATSGLSARESCQPADQSGVTSKKEVHILLRKYGMIGKSRALVDVMREAANIAPLQIPVLIQGETGTGKELLARAIHKLSRRPRKPLVAFNCATCPPDLLDAELFGHQRGAFTGAHVSRLGLVRSAEGGTLFLDEIGEMREESQARLLRLLDSGEVRPLGSDRMRRVNVRIVAATHVDLEDRIRLKLFRRDLFFRLAGIRLVLPPVRQRRGDLRELIDYFVEEAREKIRSGFAGFSEEVIEKMERYSWPGNVRQLRLEVHRYAALAREGVPIDEWTPSDDEQLAGGLMDRDEAAVILKDPAKLRQFAVDSGGQVADMARSLGVSRAHLYRTLKRLGISLSDLRKKV